VRNLLRDDEIGQSGKKKRIITGDWDLTKKMEQGHSVERLWCGTRDDDGDDTKKEEKRRKKKKKKEKKKKKSNGVS